MNLRLWNLYKNSEQGAKVISLFNFKNKIALADRLKELRSIGEKWECGVSPEDIPDELYILSGLEDLKRQNLLHGTINPKHFIDNYIFVYFDYNSQKDKFTFFPRSIDLAKDDFRNKASLTPLVSWILSLFSTKYIPIMNPFRFDLFQRNCNILEISLPDIPKTKDYRDFCIYYFKICSELQKFAKDNKLTQAELCASIYDLASMLSDNNSTLSLPAPTNVWFTGAKGSNQFKYLDELLNKKNKNDHKVTWTCNERTKRGDIIVMYCTAPRSYIHSIWRADSTGIFNPFTYYQKMTTIQNGINVPKITFNNLKKDAYWKNVPIVRGNLQGLKGVEITAEQYERLLLLFERKGMNLRKIPKLFSKKSVSFGAINIEKDVEEKILIPFLENIGYTNKDWTRQLSLKAGRKEKAIPDFVFLPYGEKHFENAPFVIEAKYDFSSMIEFQKAFSQCYSYAKMLNADIMGICDKERFLIYHKNAIGRFDKDNPIFENHWKAIYSDTTLGAQLKQIIGKEVVKSTVK